MALNFEISTTKASKLAREPISLLLANGRYNYVRVNINSEEGYFVWGKSGKESAFIVDLGIMSGALEMLLKLQLNI